MNGGVISTRTPTCYFLGVMESILSDLASMACPISCYCDIYVHTPPPPLPPIFFTPEGIKSWVGKLGMRLTVVPVSWYMYSQLPLSTSVQKLVLS